MIDELDQMQLDDKTIIIIIPSKCDAYLNDQNNWLMNNHKFPPLIEPTRQKKSYIDNR